VHSEGLRKIEPAKGCSCWQRDRASALKGRGGAVRPRYSNFGLLAEFLKGGGTMRTTIICGALMALAISEASGEGDVYSANYILPGCNAWHASVSASRIPIYIKDSRKEYCVTAVYGFTAMISDNWRCADIPRGVSIDQIVRVVIQYIDARPNRMHEPFRTLAFEALRNSWPCRK
jgi:hypothetical protein